MLHRFTKFEILVQILLDACFSYSILKLGVISKSRYKHIGQNVIFNNVYIVVICFQIMKFLFNESLGLSISYFVWKYEMDSLENKKVRIYPGNFT